jgi:hypothetical protein
VGGGDLHGQGQVAQHLADFLRGDVFGVLRIADRLAAVVAEQQMQRRILRQDGHLYRRELTQIPPPRRKEQPHRQRGRHHLVGQGAQQRGGIFHIVEDEQRLPVGV